MKTGCFSLLSLKPPLPCTTNKPWVLPQNLCPCGNQRRGSGKRQSKGRASSACTNLRSRDYHCPLYFSKKADIYKPSNLVKEKNPPLGKLQNSENQATKKEYLKTLQQFQPKSERKTSPELPGEKALMSRKGKLFWQLSISERTWRISRKGNYRLGHI